MIEKQCDVITRHTRRPTRTHVPLKAVLHVERLQKRGALELF